jgi:hypothetical protein
MKTKRSRSGNLSLSFSLSQGKAEGKAEGKKEGRIRKPYAPGGYVKSIMKLRES